MQSYALLDARTPGIVNIISNKDCKEWRIDALRKSKCVCAPLCLWRNSMNQKCMRGIIIFIMAVMCILGLIGCNGETEDIFVVDTDEMTKQKQDGMEGVERVKITADVTKIADGYFSGFHDLKYIDVAEDNGKYQSINGVLYTKDGSALVAYPMAKDVSTYTIPDKCVAVYSYAFAGSKLEQIVLPDEMYEIGYYSFYNCDSLTSMDIPKNVYYISAGAFSNCDNLESLHVDETNQYFSDINGVLFNSQKDALHTYPGGKKDSSYILPDTCTMVGEYSFSGCLYLEEIVITEEVNVPDNAFLESQIECVQSEDVINDEQ